jgi:quercetin dioxygenase-like cupin family protein
MQYTIKNSPQITLAPGFQARLIHTANLTLAYVDIEAGADLPEHFHIHEQILNLLEGEFELVLGGRRMPLQAGQVVVIPSNVPHSGRAITNCRVIDVFQPVREDLKQLSDAH